MEYARASAKSRGQFGLGKLLTSYLLGGFESLAQSLSPRSKAILAYQK